MQPIWILYPWELVSSRCAARAGEATTQGWASCAALAGSMMVGAWS